MCVKNLRLTTKNHFEIRNVYFQIIRGKNWHREKATNVKDSRLSSTISTNEN